MKKIVMMIAVLALALVLLTACGASAPQLVGAWQAEWMGTTLELEFRNDGTYTLKQGEETVVENGTYTLDGTKLTWNNGSTVVSATSQKSDNVEYLTIGYTGPDDGQAYAITYKRIR